MMTSTLYRIITGLVAFLLLMAPVSGHGEENTGDAAAPFTKQELTRMVAPIALYPDALLAQVLMASTYPLEIVAADRWLKKNPQLEGESLDTALLDESWDPSVKALCHFPSILALMSDRIGETAQLGNAFLAQADEMMDLIQELRSKAYGAGNLVSGHEQQVLENNGTITIEPTTAAVYVPYYDPQYVYGPWWYPGYPPYYWGPQRVAISAAISFWPNYHIPYSVIAWNHFDWHRHSLILRGHSRPRFLHSHQWREMHGVWRHTPHHRRGLSYHNRGTIRPVIVNPGHPRHIQGASSHWSTRGKSAGWAIHPKRSITGPTARTEQQHHRWQNRVQPRSERQASAAPNRFSNRDHSRGSGGQRGRRNR